MSKGRSRLEYRPARIFSTWWHTDGNSYNLTIAGTAMSGDTAREGGGAIFYVVDGGPGTLRISYSTLHHNPSGKFQNAPGIFSEVDGRVVAPVVVHSTIN